MRTYCKHILHRFGVEVLAGIITVCILCNHFHQSPSLQILCVGSAWAIVMISIFVRA